VRGYRQLITLFLLFADVEQADPRRFAVQDILSIDRAQSRELQQMDWFTVHVRARVDQEYGGARCGQDGGYGRAIHGRNRAQQKQRRGHHGAG
jgi:hypothetical protein